MTDYSTDYKYPRMSSRQRRVNILSHRRSGNLYTSDVIIYNDFCFEKECVNAGFLTKPNCVTRIKCDLHHQDTFDILSYPSNCKYLEEIQQFEESEKKRIFWKRLKR